jgi:hypothetical protein
VPAFDFINGHGDHPSSYVQLLIALGHRRAEDGKAKAHLLPIMVRQLEDQAGPILELLKWWKEERLKMGAGIRDSLREETGDVSSGG